MNFAGNPYLRAKLMKLSLSRANRRRGRGRCPWASGEIPGTSPTPRSTSRATGAAASQGLELVVDGGTTLKYVRGEPTVEHDASARRARRLRNVVRRFQAGVDALRSPIAALRARMGRRRATRGRRLAREGRGAEGRGCTGNIALSCGHKREGGPSLAERRAHIF
jgi:hypothetical protein